MHLTQGRDAMHLLIKWLDGVHSSLVNNKLAQRLVVLGRRQ